MKKIEDLVEKIEFHQPLVIEEVHWNGFLLRIGSESWGLYTLGAWRITKNGLLIGSAKDRKDLRVKLLEGLSVVKAKARESILLIDPILEMNNGSTLELFTSILYEPWVISFPDQVFDGAQKEVPNITQLRDYIGKYYEKSNSKNLTIRDIICEEDKISIQCDNEDVFSADGWRIYNSKSGLIVGCDDESASQVCREIPLDVEALVYKKKSFPHDYLICFNNDQYLELFSLS